MSELNGEDAGAAMAGGAGAAVNWFRTRSAMRFASAKETWFSFLSGIVSGSFTAYGVFDWLRHSYPEDVTPGVRLAAAFFSGIASWVLVDVVVLFFTRAGAIAIQGLLDRLGASVNRPAAGVLPIGPDIAVVARPVVNSAGPDQPAVVKPDGPGANGSAGGGPGQVAGPPADRRVPGTDHPGV